MEELAGSGDGCWRHDRKLCQEWWAGHSRVFERWTVPAIPRNGQHRCRQHRAKVILADGRGRTNVLRRETNRADTRGSNRRPACSESSLGQSSESRDPPRSRSGRNDADFTSNRSTWTGRKRSRLTLARRDYRRVTRNGGEALVRRRMAVVSGRGTVAHRRVASRNVSPVERDTTHDLGRERSSWVTRKVHSNCP